MPLVFLCMPIAIMHSPCCSLVCVGRNGLREGRMSGQFGRVSVGQVNDEREWGGAAYKDLKGRQRRGIREEVCLF